MRSLVQFADEGMRGVAALDAVGKAWRLEDTPSTLALAADALSSGGTLAALAEARRAGAIDLAQITLLTPIDHPDPAHVLVSGTGLTHLGSAEGRDKMHKAAAQKAKNGGDQLTDSM